jgi:hypothetical protein
MTQISSKSIQYVQRRNMKQMDNAHNHTMTQLFYATDRNVKTKNTKEIISNEDKYGLYEISSCS